MIRAWIKDQVFPNGDAGPAVWDDGNALPTWVAHPVEDVVLTLLTVTPTGNGGFNKRFVAADVLGNVLDVQDEPVSLEVASAFGTKCQGVAPGQGAVVMRPGPQHILWVADSMSRPGKHGACDLSGAWEPVVPAVDRSNGDGILGFLLWQAGLAHPSSNFYSPPAEAVTGDGVRVCLQPPVLGDQEVKGWDAGLLLDAAVHGQPDSELLTAAYAEGAEVGPVLDRMLWPS